MSEPIDRDAWRAQIDEAPLEPDIPIIDAHHHIWPEAPLAGMEPYGVQALTADKTSSGHDIIATVFVEAYTRYRKDGPPALRSVGETEFAAQVGAAADQRGAGAAGLCAAIVANADMMLGDAVEDVLLAHCRASPRRCRGVRHLVAHDRDYPGALATRPGMLSDRSFRAAFARLARHGLSFDLWVLHPQLGEVADLAAAFPHTTIVIDHLGGPLGVGRYRDPTAAGFEEWRQGLQRAAAYPNVVLKLGGLNMQYTGLCVPFAAERPWTSERMAAAQGGHLLTAIDIFGPPRCMFESNFPVDRLLTGATALWNCFKRVVAGFSAAEKAELFAGTARRTYRLAGP